MITKRTTLLIPLIILLALPVMACLDGASASGGGISFTSASSGSYTVQPGDSLSKIAQRYGTTVQALVDANKGTYPSLATNPGLIEVGWVLTIPGSGRSVAAKSEAPVSAPAPATPAIDVAAVEQEIFRLVNEERVKAGLQPLVWDPVLGEIARERSRDMAERGYFSHYDPVTGERADWVLEAQRGLPPGGENAYTNTITGLAHLPPTDIAADCVQHWMDSPGHRENALRSDYRTTGVGVAVYPGGAKIVATQIFLR